METTKSKPELVVTKEGGMHYVDEGNQIQRIPADITGLAIIEFNEDGFAFVDFGKYGILRVSEKDVERHVPDPSILSVIV